MRRAWIAAIALIVTACTPLAGQRSHETSRETSLEPGWRLIYCKGCEGEQLEFVQALGPVKPVFDGALAARRRP